MVNRLWLVIDWLRLIVVWLIVDWLMVDWLRFIVMWLVVDRLWLMIDRFWLIVRCVMSRLLIRINWRSEVV